MLNCFALTVARLWNDKILVFSRKQVTTCLSKLRKINTLHILHQSVNYQCFHREYF